MKAIKILKAFTNAIFMTKEDILKVDEAIAELKQLQKRILYLESIEIDLIMKDNKTTFKDYSFTNCNDCINKVDYKFTSACFGCKRYYSCRFKRKD